MSAYPARVDDRTGPWSASWVLDPEYDDGVPVDLPDSALAIPAVGAMTFGPSGKAIGVAQEQGNWCWAASVQMIRRHVGLERRAQCEIASKHLGKLCCLAPADCNVPIPFDELTSVLAENGLHSMRERAQLDSERFWKELFARRPILLADLPGKGADGHVRVAFGWQKLRRGALVVRIVDPAEAKKASTPFEELQRSRWRETWYGIEVRDGAS